MDKNNYNNTIKAGMSFTVRPKSPCKTKITSSVLGMANSHGIKLSVNMTSEDQKELMSKLEEWRQARKDKLVARILRKKQFQKTNASVPVLAPKSRLHLTQCDGAAKFQDQQSVFERLYINNNNGKIKKLDVKSSLNNPTSIQKFIYRKASLMPFEKQTKPVQMSDTDADRTSLHHMSIEPSTSVAGKEHELNAIDESVAEKSGGICVTVSANESKSTGATSHVSEYTNLSKADSLQTEKESIAESVKGIHMTNMTKRDSEKYGLVLENFGAKARVQLVGPEKLKNPLRRSISMMFRQKCKNEYTIRRSISSKNLKEFNLSQEKINRGNVRTVLQPNTLKEGKSETAVKTVSLDTPKPKNSSGSDNLRFKLEDWLKKNGHSLENYRHLLCFGIANSEKSFPSATPLDHSFENVFDIAPGTPLNHSDKENFPSPVVVQQVDISEVKNWLKELHRLIVELKYPPERCEEWLTAVRKKCNASTQLPIYWECFAALHESKGDLKSAIKDYERAIIKGGEVDVLGESLVHLFEKMVIEQGQCSKPKLEKGLDPQNIFKSTIIKFALQQKVNKKLNSKLDLGATQQLYVATPVRRSTRIQTPNKTPGEVASLQNLAPELRKNVTFKPNESLMLGD